MDLIRVYLASCISHLISIWKQGLRHARTTRNYICVRRKTWASKVDLGQAGLRNGGRITSSAITKRNLSPHGLGLGKRERVRVCGRCLRNTR
jgi:hypothetical protein